MSEHTHHHSPESTRKLVNRMSRAIGHMEAIKKMLEDDRDCSEILIQLSAVRSAINGIGRLVLQEHIDHCVVDALESGDRQVLDDLNEAIERFLK